MRVIVVDGTPRRVWRARADQLSWQICTLESEHRAAVDRSTAWARRAGAAEAVSRGPHVIHSARASGSCAPQPAAATWPPPEKNDNYIRHSNVANDDRPRGSTYPLSTTLASPSSRTRAAAPRASNDNASTTGSGLLPSGVSGAAAAAPTSVTWPSHVDTPAGSCLPVAPRGLQSWATSPRCSQTDAAHQRHERGTGPSHGSGARDAFQNVPVTKPAEGRGGSGTLQSGGPHGAAPCVSPVLQRLQQGPGVTGTFENDGGKAATLYPAQWGDCALQQEEQRVGGDADVEGASTSVRDRPGGTGTPESGGIRSAVPNTTRRLQRRGKQGEATGNASQVAPQMEDAVPTEKKLQKQQRLSSVHTRVVETGSPLSRPCAELQRRPPEPGQSGFHSSRNTSQQGNTPARPTINATGGDASRDAGEQAGGKRTYAGLAAESAAHARKMTREAGNLGVVAAVRKLPAASMTPWEYPRCIRP